VWDEEPQNEMLLAARLQRGWQPKASDLAGGQRILGYACRIE